MADISKIERKGILYNIKDVTARTLLQQKYTVPIGGIPKEDLSLEVQNLLQTAKTAIQNYTETDPTVPAWAKSVTKPTYTASEVGALPDDTVIPDKVSQLDNDSGYTNNIGTITGITMNGVIIGTSGSVDLGQVLTSHQDLSGKQDVLISDVNIKSINGQSVLGSGDIDTLDAEVDEESETLILS